MRRLLSPGARARRWSPSLCRVLREPETQAPRYADGDVLVFVDADVIVPHTLLDAIHTAMSDPACVGGAVDVDYRPKRLSIRLYLRAWRLLGRLMGMAQGATQFCRKSVFEQVGGYDERVWIGEDVDFYWGLKRFAKWPVWRTLIWTNPLFIGLFRRWKTVWRSWYSHAVR